MICVQTEEDCIHLMFDPQVRLGNVGGDVLAVGGMALELLDSVEQVSEKGFEQLKFQKEIFFWRMTFTF